MIVQNILTNHIVDHIYTTLRVSLHSRDPLANRILDQILTQPGKGVRPVFMALVAELIGGAWESIEKGACVIESVHIASLLHDDVVDGALLRRGTETLNSRHSDKVSVLFGDHIILRAFTMAHDIPDDAVLTIILEVARRMVRGEIRDVLEKDCIDENQYLEVIGDKTASLFAGAAELSIVLAGGEDPERKLAHELGEYVGLSFQIIDDALDYNGDRVHTGKHLNSDFRAGIMTLPLIYSLRSMPPEEKKRFLADKHISDGQLKNFVTRRGGIEYAFLKSREYTEKARSIVARFGNPAAEEKFDNFFDMLLSRSA